MRVGLLAVSLLSAACSLPPPEEADLMPGAPALSTTSAGSTGTQPLPPPSGSIQPGTVSQTATGKIEFGGLTICDLGVELEHTTTATGLELAASVVNYSDQPIVLALPNACPGGPVQLEGLPAGYDPYQSCAPAACGASRPATLSVTVPAGRAKVPLARLEVEAQPPCGAPLGEGLLYHVSGVIPASAAPGHEVCSSRQIMVGIINGKATLR